MSAADSDVRARAVVDESFTPQTVQVEAPEPGRGDELTLHLLALPLGANLFMQGRSIRLSADLAVQLGEHLAAEGRKVRSGLVIAPAGAGRGGGL